MPQSGHTQIALLGTISGDTVTGVTTGTSIPVFAARSDELCFTFESIGTTSGGTLLIEEASRRNYSGTWSVIATVLASSFTGTAEQTYHISQNAYSHVRVRISSTITGGGTVAVFLDKQGT